MINRNMKFSKKIIASILLVVVSATFFVINPTKSRMKSYYSGDSISFNNKIYIGSINTGNLELFTVEGDTIYKKMTIASIDHLATNFFDLKLTKENNRLYVYVVNGRYLYKYDITNIRAPKIIIKIKDNSWDWFSRVDIIDGKLVTVGSKGIKVWDKKYRVINSYSLVSDKDLGTVSFSKDGDIVLTSDNKVSTFKMASRKKTSEFTITTRNSKTRRVAYNDQASKMIYIVDDSAVRAVNTSGQTVRVFGHTSDIGYDVASSVNPNYIYFSDGIGVVKMNKNDFKVIDWNYTTRLGIAGSWAMGIKPVYNNGEESLVVFNGSNILVLDGEMEEVAHYKSVEKDIRPIEDLALGVDKPRATAGEQISLRGKGFGLNEELEIKILKTKINVMTDENGRFKKVITVPTAFPIKTDIKVVGKTSGRTYSISFEIK